uniref:Agglutinin C-terminal domain-containing protein n=1 Tax=viral metagenome TaxID=1070528 RepID=A0A6M3INK4_9ZZZZ
MGVIVELAHAKKRIKELEAQIAEPQPLEFYETQQPVSTQQITFNELYHLLRSFFPNAGINLGENYRFLCHYDDIAVFLAQDQTNKMDYVSDSREISSYDCNVFANRLLGQFSVPGWADLTFGKVWLSVPAHALNIAITEDKNLWYVEPQTDELKEFTTYEPANIRFVEM